jgi:hypothetical protein
MERILKPEQTPTPVHAKEIMAQTLARADITKKPPPHAVDNTGETMNEKCTTAIPEWQGRDESGPQGPEYSKLTPYSIYGKKPAFNSLDHEDRQESHVPSVSRQIKASMPSQSLVMRASEPSGKTATPQYRNVLYIPLTSGYITRDAYTTTEDEGEPLSTAALQKAAEIGIWKVLNITSKRRKEILTRAAMKSMFEVVNMLEKELKPKEFSDMYIAILKTLAKDYIEMKSSKSSTQSNSPVRQQETVGHIPEGNMTTQENTLMLKSKHETDPIINSAIGQVAAPRQQDELSEVYEQQNAVAQCIRKMMDAQYQDEAMTECIIQEEAETIHEINRIYPPPRNMPLLDEWNDHVSFQ